MTDDTTEPPPIDTLTALITRHKYDEATTCLDKYQTAEADAKKNALYSLKPFATNQPTKPKPILSSLTPFLIHGERSVRLTTAKLFVTVAESAPDIAVPLIPTLADRLADDEEFYYVRARWMRTARRLHRS